MNVEDIYKKVTQLEHVLLRPDTYVGSIEPQPFESWLYDGERFVKREVELAPGLYKIFDEILVNAADNFERDKNAKSLVVEVSCNRISVENDGRGIPVQMHKEQKVWVPELIFGHLLTSSNYDDTIKKVTGGRNGFGAKLTNIFSRKFTVETCDGHKVFKMVWSDNMHKHTDAEIKDCKGQAQFTRVTFEPDFSRFRMRELSEDAIQLLQRRVADLAGILGPRVKVTLNGRRVAIKDFREYINMFGVGQYVYTKTENNGRRWEVGVSSSDGQGGHVSFVNCIHTSRGGTHVQHVLEQVVEGVMEEVKRKHKELKGIKAFQVRQHIQVFLNCQIENPSFDSQTKETLMTKVSQFGSRFELTPKFLEEIIKKTDIMAKVVEGARGRMDSQLASKLKGKKQSRLLGVEKLEDANDAGTRYGSSCTLILTEGDSAKSLAMAGVEVVGRDRYGVFPLRGKLLNVRDANSKQIMENKEIEQLVKILGLQFNRSYENTNALRYGSVLIMTDQDHDGHHIKGLIINLFEKFWPSLLKMPGFLKQFVTPLVKATNKNDVVSFFSMGDFKKWLERTPNAHNYKVKYYKGLGTSTDQEGQQYFSHLSKHVKPFKYVDTQDNEYIDLVFNKAKADARKEWLLRYSWHNMMDTLDYSQSNVRYKDFITDCLALYSVSDNLRSLPSLVDGLKPTQRKILYTLLTHSQQHEYKVAALAGLVSSYTNYHHGEQSLHSTIVTMAQNFTGANNLNLLLPLGQFGSRANAGKDAASARYIYTKLNPITTKLFHPDDLHTLNYLEEDGTRVEPQHFVPILPTLLLNGAEGIGTGWSTSVPMYNPREIALAIKDRLKGTPFTELTPWYRHFTGTMLYNASKNSFAQTGTFIRAAPDTLYITEIPVKTSIKDLQTLLLAKIQSEDVRDIKEYHSGNKVCFQVLFREGYLSQTTDANLLKVLKLNANINLNNIVLFDQQGTLRRYAGTAHVLEEFYKLRLEYYTLRKNYLVSKLQHELDIANNKVNFLEGMINNTLNLRNLKKQEMVELLAKHKFKAIDQITKVKSTLDNNNNNNDNNAYDYLLSMPFWSFSQEKITELRNQQNTLSERLKVLQTTTTQQMWEQDLDALLQEMDKQEKAEEQEHLKRLEKVADKLCRGGGQMLRGKKVLDVEEEYDYDSDDDDKPKKKDKTMAQVIRELANLGVSSKRTPPPRFELKNGGAKNQDLGAGDIEIDVDDEDLEKALQNNKMIVESDSDEKPKGKKKDESKQAKLKEQEENSQKKQKEEKPKRVTTKKIVIESDESSPVTEKKKNNKKKTADSDSEVEVMPKKNNRKNQKAVESQSEEEVMPKRNNKRNQKPIESQSEEEVMPKKNNKRNQKAIESESEVEQNQKKSNNNKRKVESDSDVEVIPKKNNKRIQKTIESDLEEVLPKEKPKRGAKKEKQVEQQDKENLDQVNKKVKVRDEKEKLNQEKEKEDKPREQQINSLYDKYGLTQFLKYLDGGSGQKSKDPGEMTLAERLLMKQQNGIEQYIFINLGTSTVIEKSYNEAKQRSEEKQKNLNNAEISIEQLMSLEL